MIHSLILLNLYNHKIHIIVLREKLKDWPEDKDYHGAWIGLTDLLSQGTGSQNREMRWDTGETPSYQNWVYGHPEAGQDIYDGLSGACGAIEPGSEKENGEWGRVQNYRSISIIEKVIELFVLSGEK